MTIGIDASRAFLARRTGIEEYSYQVVRHMRAVLPPDIPVVLYVRKQLAMRTVYFGFGFTLRIPRFQLVIPTIDFELPEHWRVRGIFAPRFFTQIGLSLEMLLHRPDVLFVPAHTVPIVHPKRTLVTIHGLEYEFSPESYSRYERWYMRFFIRRSVHWASRIIAVSESTKRDLVRLYHVPEEKIAVIYEGIGGETDDRRLKREKEPRKTSLASSFQLPAAQFFLFIGRLETRKNVVRIIEAFEYFKEKTGLAHALVLVGKPGFGYEGIRAKIQASKFKLHIHELGYIAEAEKWTLLQQAAALVFPSLYEGFGLPILEAQVVGVPVVTSAISSLPEVAGLGAILVNPLRSREIGRALVTLATDQERRADIIDKATRNADRFRWSRCAREVASLLRG